jgi:hypothetical protein
MPGHILRAQCRCGFERELAPGGNERSLAADVIAYNADESDLVTEDETAVKLMGLRTIRDPFLSNHEPAHSLGPQGPYLCPGCKETSLMLHFSGNWD